MQLDVRPLCRLAHIGLAQHFARMNPPDPVAGLLERPLSPGLRLLGQIATTIRVRRYSPRKNRRARDGVTALCDKRLLLTRVA